MSGPSGEGDRGHSRQRTTLQDGDEDLRDAFRWMLASIRRRGNDVVDIAGDGTYRRLLDHDGTPLLITVTAADYPALSLEVERPDGAPDPADGAAAERAFRRIASLDRSPLPFYDRVRDDPVLGPITRSHRGLRPLGSAGIFEMLIVAILGQQISMIAAGAIKRRMVEHLGLRARIGERTYHAFPTSAALAEASEDELIALSFSRRKAEYVRGIARLVAEGALDLEGLRGRSHDAIVETLVALRGIGRWTAEYVLLRGYGYPDALPAGDVGLRNQIARLYGLQAHPTEAEIIARAEAWRPYRSWATIYLWNAHLEAT